MHNNQWNICCPIKKAVFCMILIFFLPAAVYGGEITLEWDPSEDVRVRGYNIYYGKTGTYYEEEPALIIHSAAQTSALISDLEEGATYEFAVTSRSVNGSESGFSEVILHTVDAGAGRIPEPGADRIPPEAPVLLAPSNFTVDIKKDIVLKTKAFMESGGGIHYATHWQISNMPDFTDAELVLDVTSAEHLIQLPVSFIVFEEHGTYSWRVRHINSYGLPSAWSDNHTLTTTAWVKDKNGNGLVDAQEPREATDLDADGVPDDLQGDLTSIRVGDNRQMAVKIPEAAGFISFMEWFDPAGFAETDLKPIRLPFGLINFKVRVDAPGDSVDVTVYYSESVPEDAAWFMYDVQNGWYDASGFSAAASNRKSIALQLTDGGSGDADGVANGVILVTGGPGASVPGNQPPGSGDSGNSRNSGSSGCFINSIL
jgi:hypothetical protein